MGRRRARWSWPGPARTGPVIISRGRGGRAGPACWPGAAVRCGGQVLAAGTAGRAGGEYGVTHLAVAPPADDAGAAAAVLAVLAGLEPEGGAARVILPGPHPAVRALLAAGWRVEESDLFMATEPGLLDPRRAVPSPALA
jgi:hypothetical protein